MVCRCKATSLQDEGLQNHCYYVDYNTCCNRGCDRSLWGTNTVQQRVSSKEATFTGTFTTKHHRWRILNRNIPPGYWNWTEQKCSFHNGQCIAHTMPPYHSKHYRSNALVSLRTKVILSTMLNIILLSFKATNVITPYYPCQSYHFITHVSQSYYFII